jgi:acyl-[acyl-carrier-protein]-phospholipid O-acyltransferase/long-chain-fatty-acid--[acyl-carrier-protein] ligase
VADSTGMELTGHQLLVRTLIVRRLLERDVLDAGERFVGLLLPPSAGAVIANAALPLLGRVPVNLNYTTSSAAINSAIAQCGIRHVIASRRVLERFKLNLDAEIVHLEDFRTRVTLADKLMALAQSRLPVQSLERSLGITGVSRDDLLTVMFTSGSTGEPKGVMLSHDNVATQIDAMRQAVDLRAGDVALGVLPFFHAYGYTATLWTVLTLPLEGVYHYDPRDAQQVGTLCRTHRATMLMSIPTFLRTYLRRVPPDDFRSLDVVFASSEKLSTELSDAFEARFGVRPFDGYGCTELSPVVALNVPPGRTADPASSAREGTVGRTIPGVTAKVVDPETGEDLTANEPGMLQVRGPNVMKGYLNHPDATAQVLRGGWYVTGDIAAMDADGFIEIRGRRSRFSKIAGEMVPHIRVEELLQPLLGGDEEHLVAAVTGVPDSARGERLVVLHRPARKSPDLICRELAAAGLPNLWIPAPDMFFEVPELPVLGTGKLDLRRLNELALGLLEIAWEQRQVTG